MKRAWTERAKQQQSSISSPPPTTTDKTLQSPASPRTTKKQRTTTTTTTTSTSGKSNADNEFYLQHQNRALATELQSLQCSVKELQEERDARRAHCRAAFRSVAELAAVWQTLDLTHGDDHTNDTTTATPTIPSTGTGDDVEYTTALERALVALGASPSEHNTTLQGVLSTVQQRAQSIRERIQQATTYPTASNDDDDDDDLKLSLHTRCTELQAQASELAASRQHVCSRERRLRRNLYRMAAGMLTPEQVVKSLDTSDEDSDTIQAAVRLEQAAQQQSAAQQQPTDDTAAAAAAPVTAVASAEAIAEMEELKERIRNLESSILRSEDAIKDLNTEISQKEERITLLSKRQLSPDDAERLKALESTKIQLETSGKTVASLQSKLDRREQRWALALGNEKQVLESSNELIAKFNKRWSELTGMNSSAPIPEEEPKHGSIANDDADTSIAWNTLHSLPPDSPEVALTQQVGELQHKLEQAMEHVRQAESARDNLKIAIEMNSTLQAKFDEVRAKYAVVQTARNANLAATHQQQQQSSKETKSTATATAVATGGGDKKREGNGADTKPSSSSNDAARVKHQKMYESYKRAKHEVSQLTARKDELKAKLERTEKERDALMDSNRKLLKQVGEKDEMNATSLSTILHLKSQTDKLAVERNQLEEQSRAASQLALAARLATNAKEKVTEEVLAEKEALEKRVQDLEKDGSLLRAEIERVSQQWSQASGQMAVKDTELQNVMDRSKELVEENEQKRGEIRKLMDVVTRAEQEARTAKEKLVKAKSSGMVPSSSEENGNHSAFSVDQLQTQIDFLKNRLACPVCHYRDKECIILRCRHMHCKQCVDERISNRSRKCPTCNVKFSENEVGDIWLN